MKTHAVIFFAAIGGAILIRAYDGFLFEKPDYFFGGLFGAACAFYTSYGISKAK